MVKPFCYSETRAVDFPADHDATLICDQELCMATEIMKSMDTSFLQMVGGLSCRDGMRSVGGALSSKSLLLHIKRSRLRWFRHLTRMPPGLLIGEVFWA